MAATTLDNVVEDIISCTNEVFTTMIPLELSLTAHSIKMKR